MTRTGMSKGRLEAFSDGVLAIIITIMVLELPLPHSADLAGLQTIVPKLLSYAMSYVFLGIYWNNHHHLLQAVKHVDGRALWANLAMLFWLSLVPFVTAWMGENHFAPWPVALYGVVLVCSGISYFVLSRILIEIHGDDSAIARALGSDFKGRASVELYLVAIGTAFANRSVSIAIYVLVAVMWLVPDRRIEHAMTAD